MIRLVALLLAALLLPAAGAHAQKLDATPRTVVMTAFAPEWEALRPAIEDAREHRVNGNTFVTGTLEGRPVILMQTGVSVVNAAMNTQLVLDRFTVARIVFSGIAGGVDPALGIGDVVVAEDWGQYLEASFARETPDGWMPPEPVRPEAPANWNFIFPRGTDVTSEARPKTRLFRIPADPALLALAREVVPKVALSRCNPPRADRPASEQAQCLPHTPRAVVGGTGVTAGIYADNAAFRDYLHTAWGARLLDMESAAVMQVAASNMVPAIVFRGLSDLAGGDQKEIALPSFSRLASHNAARVVRAFLAGLPE